MSHERRNAYRFPVMDGQQEAVLRVVDTEMQGRLIDHSATGFSIHVFQHPGCFAGETVWLKTVNGWSSVRVVKVQQQPDGIRIGLERLEDSSMAVRAKTQRVDEDQEHLRKNVLSRRAKWLIAGMSTVFTGVVVCLVWIVVIKCTGGEIHPVQILLGSETPIDPRPAAVQGMEIDQLRHRSQLRESISTAGPMVILLPDVTERLQLSEDQRAAVDGIARRTKDAAEKIQKATSYTEAELERLNKAALEEALGVLTPEQLAHWKALVHEALEDVE